MKNSIKAFVIKPIKSKVMEKKIRPILFFLLSLENILHLKFFAQFHTLYQTMLP